MAKSGFEATWLPRIGDEATAELRRYRYVIGFGPITMCVLGGAAGLLFGTSTLSDLFAAVLVAIAVGILVAYVYRQRKLAAALS